MQRVQLFPDAPVVILDWSFFVFWRFFATKSWYGRKGGITEPLEQNANFVEDFKRTFVRAVETLRRKYGAPRSNLIALMDAPRATLWRKLILTTYKDNRNSSIEGGFFAIAESLHAEMGVQSIRIEGLEADDLAALVKTRLIELGVGDIVMLTDDNDWGQLASADASASASEPRVRVINKDDKDLGVRCGDLHQKILCGDPGDNIPPAFARCGKATAKRYADDPAALEEYFSKNPEARGTYERNRLLIDLSRIPQECVDGFRAQVDVTLLSSSS